MPHLDVTTYFTLWVWVLLTFFLLFFLFTQSFLPAIADILKARQKLIQLGRKG